MMSPSENRENLNESGESGPGPASLHLRPFKLRFAPQRQPGRSYVSSIKPMGLPAIVKDKFYRCESEGEVQPDMVKSALYRVRGMFKRGPKEKYEEPITSSHEYGWWWDSNIAKEHALDQRLQHHIRDSAWMKEQLRVLASDASYKRL